MHGRSTQIRQLEGFGDDTDGLEQLEGIVYILLNQPS
jgi:hypothetical protein